MRKNITFSKSLSSNFIKKSQEIAESQLRKLFLVTGATFNSDTNCYELNGLKDITEEEMIEIYDNKEAVYKLDIPFLLQNHTPRTLIAVNGVAGKKLKNRPLSSEGCFSDSPVEILKFSTEQSLCDCAQENLLPVKNLTGTFTNCHKLRMIYPMDISQISQIGETIFDGCTLLEEIRLHGLNNNIRIVHSPQISLASLCYIVNNACNERSITINVHPDIFRRFMIDEQSEEQPTASKNPWKNLKENAKSKNIFFDTPSLIVFVSDNILYINKCSVGNSTVATDSEYAKTEEGSLCFIL